MRRSLSSHSQYSNSQPLLCWRGLTQKTSHQKLSDSNYFSHRCRISHAIKTLPIDWDVILNPWQRFEPNSHTRCNWTIRKNHNTNKVHRTYILSPRMMCNPKTTCSTPACIHKRLRFLSLTARSQREWQMASPIQIILDIIIILRSFMSSNTGKGWKDKTRTVAYMSTFVE